jgi:hypothetical protein
MNEGDLSHAAEQGSEAIGPFLPWRTTAPSMSFRWCRYFAKYPIAPSIAAALPTSITAADQAHRLNCFRLR